jgi:hypothetical protein
VPGTFVPLQAPTAAQLNAIVDKIMADPVTTASSGTATTSTTDTRDDVLGVYVFTAGTSRRYRVTIAGLHLSAVSGDLAVVRVRDGGASTPTNASTSLGFSQWRAQATGGTGQTICPFSVTFTPSSGTRTLAAFTQLSVGTGPITPVGSREIYVEDVGAA